MSKGGKAKYQAVEESKAKVNKDDPVKKSRHRSKELLVEGGVQGKGRLSSCFAT